MLVWGVDFIGIAWCPASVNGANDRRLYRVGTSAHPTKQNDKTKKTTKQKRRTG